jgi:hypothetical protein
MSIGGKFFIAFLFLVLDAVASLNHWGAIPIGLFVGGFASFFLSAIVDVFRKAKPRIKSGARAVAKRSKSVGTKVTKRASTFVQKTSQSKEEKILNIDDELFEIANDEIESNNQKKGLWAKAFAISEGDERKQKAVYLRLRVEQLKEKTNTSEKGDTKTQSMQVDGESDFIPSDSVQKPKQPEPEPRKPDEPSAIENVKIHRAEIKADLARWRKAPEQHKASQPQPQPRSQKTHEQTSPAPISNEQTILPIYLFFACLVIVMIFVFLSNDAYEQAKPESSVKTGESPRASKAYESPYRKVVDFQRTQCEAGEANACRTLANAYRKGQMDLVKNLNLAKKYEAMAQIEAQEEADAENTITSFSANAGDVYTVEEFLSAEFGGQPFLAGDLGSGKLRVKSYQYFDKENFIVYALGFDAVRSIPPPESEVPLLLKAYANSQASAVGSSLSSYRTETIGHQLVAFYTILYYMKGLTWKKVSMLTMVHGRNISWSVQKRIGYSSIIVESIFNQSYKKLRICGHSLNSYEIPVCDPK